MGGQRRCWGCEGIEEGAVAGIVLGCNRIREEGKLGGSAGHFLGPWTPTSEAGAEPSRPGGEAEVIAVKVSGPWGQEHPNANVEFTLRQCPLASLLACWLACLYANQQPGPGRHSRNPGPYQELGSSRNSPVP